MAARAIFGAAVLMVAACSPFPEGQRRMESVAELRSKQDADYAASPDVRLPELRRRLRALGVADANMRLSVDDNDVPILMLTFSEAQYARLDKAALAKLVLDSRYRFRLTEPRQITDFAGFSVDEIWARDGAIALKELADKGEMDRFPRYVPGRSMNIYARQLEAYCGYRPGEALRVTDGKWLEYNNQVGVDIVTDPYNAHRLASFHCMRRIVYGTKLGPHFIGNRPRPGAIIS